LVKGRVEYTEITLLNVYNPPEQAPEFISKMLNLLITEAKGTTVMGGDLNLIMNPTLDCQRNIKHKAEKAAASLRRADSEVGLIDVWRTLHPKENYYTYYSSAHRKYSRFFMIKTNHSPNQAFMVEWPDGSHSSVKGT
uniref:Endonuclease/exonuclease/phosphatase domain-containing protein n=1 Tax=Hucho hucho TaxID=62062 RepID=A0A4W5NL85_9TELE